MREGRLGQDAEGMEGQTGWGRTQGKGRQAGRLGRMESQRDEEDESVSRMSKVASPPPDIKEFRATQCSW